MIIFILIKINEIIDKYKFKKISKINKKFKDGNIINNSNKEN